MVGVAEIELTASPYSLISRNLQVPRVKRLVSCGRPGPPPVFTPSHGRYRPTRLRTTDLRGGKPTPSAESGQAGGGGSREIAADRLNPIDARWARIEEFSGRILARRRPSCPISRRWPVGQRHCRDVDVNRLVPQRKRGARFDLTQRAPRGIVALQACAQFHRASIRPKRRPRGRFHQAVAWVVPHPLDGDVEVLSIATPRGRAIAPSSRATVKAPAIAAGIRATRRHR